MKKYRYVLLMFLSAVFCSGSCERAEPQYVLTIQNNSDKEIVFQGSLYFSMALDTMCFKPMTKMEYQSFIRYNSIKPYSSKKSGADFVIHRLQDDPKLILSLGIFNRIDIDRMSCEEFKQVYPLKKEWKLTLADMQACDWTLVYTPDD